MKYDFYQRLDAKDKLIVKKEKDVEKLTLMLKNELPLLTKSLQQSQTHMKHVKNNLAMKEIEFKELQKIHDLARKKNKILEEELEKSLKFNQTYEDDLKSMKSQNERITEQIRELWQYEVKQNLNNTQSVNNSEVPMPLTWLAEISDHIAQIKRMNDFQRDEVYNLFSLIGDRDMKREMPHDDVQSCIDIYPNQRDSASDYSSSNQSATISEKAAGTISNNVKSQSSRIERFSQTHRNDELVSEADEFEIRDSLHPLDSNYDYSALPTRTGTNRQNYQYSGRQHSREMSFSVQDRKDQPSPFVQEFQEPVAQYQSQPEFGVQTSKSVDRGCSTRMSSAQGQVLSNAQARTSRHQPISGAYQSSSSIVNDKLPEPRRDHTAQPILRHQNILGGVQTTRHDPVKNRNLFGVNSTKSQDYTQRIRFQSYSQGSDIEQPSTRQTFKDEKVISPKSRVNIRMITEPQVISLAYNDPVPTSSQQQTTDRQAIQFALSNGQISNGQNRNELYSMLREEIRKMRAEISVGKETIYTMKRELNAKQKELVARVEEIEAVREKKETVEIRCQSLEDELIDAEAQIEELNAVIADREKCINDHRENINDFERELCQLTERMNKVIKLNTEISSASEHWEACYQKAKQDIQRMQEQHQMELEQQKQKFINFEQMLQQKLDEREKLISNSNRLLEKERKWREAQEKTREQARDQHIQTEPDMELLEKQNSALQKQLTQVKADISAVLDQFDKEQSTNSTLKKKVSKHKEISKKVKKELAAITSKHVQCDREIGKLKEELSKQQGYYQDQLHRSEQNNVQLQSQIEIVTQMSEELQEQLRIHENSVIELQTQLENVNMQADEKDELVQEYQKAIKTDRERIKKLKERVSQLKSQKEVKNYNESSNLRQNEVQIYGNHTANFGNSCHNCLPKPRTRNTSQSVHSSVYKTQTNSDYFTLKPHDDFDEQEMLKQSLDERQRPRSHQRMGQHKESRTQSRQENTLDYYPQHQQSTTTNPDRASSSYINTTEEDTVVEELNSRPRTRTTQAHPCSCRDVCTRRTEQCDGCRQYRSLTPNNLTSTLPDGINISALLENSNVNSYNCCQHIRNQYQPQFNSQLNTSHPLNFSAEMPSPNVKACQCHVKYLGMYPNESYRSRDIYQHHKNVQNTSKTRELNTKRKIKKVTQYMEELVKHYNNKANYIEEKFIQERDGVLSNTERSTNDTILEAKAFFAKRHPEILNGLKQLVRRKQFWLSEIYKQGQPMIKEPPSIISARFADENYNGSQRTNMTATPSQTELINGLPPLHLRKVYQNQQSATEITERSQATAYTQTDEMHQQLYQAQIVNAQLNQQYKAVFSKLVQTGRSLAGICYGGSLFLNQNEDYDPRQGIEQAMNFLSQDTNELEEISSGNLDNFGRIFENLLSCLSKIVSTSCSHLLKAADRAKTSDQNKSLDLSIDEGQNEHFKTHNNKTEPSIANQNSNNGSKVQLSNLQIRDKLLEVETKLKYKFSSIKALEEKLEQLLSTCRLQQTKQHNLDSKQNSLTSIQSQYNLGMDSKDLFKLLSAIKRVISKLKIELHQDYLLVGQVNVVFSKENSQDQTFYQPSRPSTTEPPTQSFIKVQSNQSQARETSGTLSAVMQNNFSVGSCNPRLQAWTPSLNQLNDSQGQKPEMFGSQESMTQAFINTDSEDKLQTVSRLQTQTLNSNEPSGRLMASTFGNSLRHTSVNKQVQLDRKVHTQQRQSSDGSITRVADVQQFQVQSNRDHSAKTQKQMDNSQHLDEFKISQISGQHQTTMSFSAQPTPMNNSQMNSHVTKSSQYQQASQRIRVDTHSTLDNRTMENQTMDARKKQMNLLIDKSALQSLSSQQMNASLPSRDSDTFNRVADQQHINKIVEELQRLTFDDEN